MTSAAVADPTAREFLRNADPVLARVIDAHPGFRPRAWIDELPGLDAFGTLIFQVAGQQLSVRATRTILSRVEATESCWPATWKMSVPKASSAGSSSIQARGRKPGFASMIRPNSGSALRSEARALGSATAARLRRGAATVTGLATGSRVHLRTKLASRRPVA